MRWLRAVWYWFLNSLAVYGESQMGLDYTVLPPDSPAETGPWTIRYTTATITWREGSFWDLGMAQMNARLASHAGLMAEVEPLYPMEHRTRS